MHVRKARRRCPHSQGCPPTPPPVPGHGAAETPTAASGMVSVNVKSYRSQRRRGLRGADAAPLLRPRALEPGALGGPCLLFLASRHFLKHDVDCGCSFTSRHLFTLLFIRHRVLRKNKCPPLSTEAPSGRREPKSLGSERCGRASSVRAGDLPTLCFGGPKRGRAREERQ